VTLKRANDGENEKRSKKHEESDNKVEQMITQATNLDNQQL